MRVLLLTVVAALTLSGCAFAARDLGYAGAHPGRVTCKGKGVLTITGSGALVGGLGVGNTGTATLTGDCGDGFSFEQGAPVPNEKK